MEFIPTQSGSYHYATLNPRHFNPFDCDGDFKNIGSSRDADSLANHICSKLEGLKQVATTENTVEDQNKAPEKRKLTPLYASMQPTKKQKVVEESSCVKGIMERLAMNASLIVSANYMYTRMCQFETVECGSL